MRILTHSVMADHQVPEGFPEHAGRYHALRAMIQTDFPKISLENAAPVSDDILRLAHTQDHIDSMKTDSYIMIDGDTALSPASYDAACHAVGAAIAACDCVLSGQSNTAFALTRPPGHHASSEKAEGFCLFNTVFIAARNIVKNYPDTKVLIMDFDVHHGNGTEALLETYLDEGGENIAYASVHQEGIYPGTGYKQNRFIYNCPLLSGSGSADFRDSITYDIIPFAEKFAPDIILYSAGFDGHRDDPLAGLNYSHEDYAWVVDAFSSISRKQVSILEGGYNLEALAISAHHHLKALANLS